MSTYIASGSFGWAGGGKAGAVVDLWATSRFASPPSEGSAPPVGNADAGPVVTGDAFGNPGAWMITNVATVQDYYVRVQYGGVTYWGSVPSGTLSGQSGGGGGGGAVSSVSADGTGTVTVNPTTGAVQIGVTPGVFAPIASPNFTGSPTAPTQTVGDNSTKLASTGFVTAAVANSTAGVSQITAADSTLTFSASTGAVTAALSASEVAVIAAKAPLVSPALTGTPTAPTATALTDSTQIGTTGYTDAAVATETAARTAANALKANIASPTLTGIPAAPTPAVGTNSTQLATTAFVENALLVPANVRTTNYSPVLSDLNGVVEMNATTGLAVTLNSGIFSAGDVFEICQVNTGSVAVVPGSGMTIDSLAGANTIAGRWGTCSVRYRSGSEAVLSGALNTLVALVQQVSNITAGTGAVTATTPGSVNSANNLILGIEAFAATTNTAGTITDTAGGTWTNLRVSSDALTTQYQWYICLNPAAGVHAVTWTPAAPTTYGAQMMLTEWSGGPFTLDQISTNSYASGTSGGTPSITPVQAGELILVMASADGTGSTMTTPTNGFTSLAPAGTHNPCAYLIGASTSAISCNWTLTPADTGTGSIAAFIP